MSCQKLVSGGHIPNFFLTTSSQTCCWAILFALRCTFFLSLYFCFHVVLELMPINYTCAPATRAIPSTVFFPPPKQESPHSGFIKEHTTWILVSRVFRNASFKTEYASRAIY